MTWLERMAHTNKGAIAIQAIMATVSQGLSEEEILALPPSVLRQWKRDILLLAGDVFIYNSIAYRSKVEHITDVSKRPNVTPEWYEKIVVKTGEGGGQTGGGTGTQPEAWQPRAYDTGERCLFGGKVYESKVDNNTRNPQAYPAGWKLIS